MAGQQCRAVVDVAIYSLVGVVGWGSVQSWVLFIICTGTNRTNPYETTASRLSPPPSPPPFAFSFFFSCIASMPEGPFSRDRPLSSHSFLSPFLHRRLDATSKRKPAWESDAIITRCWIRAHCMLTCALYDDDVVLNAITRH